MITEQICYIMTGKQHKSTAFYYPKFPLPWQNLQCAVAYFRPSPKSMKYFLRKNLLSENL